MRALACARQDALNGAYNRHFMQTTGNYFGLPSHCTRRVRIRRRRDGRQPTGHKFIRVGGTFAHSQECDHAIRIVAAPTPDEIERAKRHSPGA